ncbi:ABC transporter ATP-binding protein (plasmid) [Enterobacter bugandensis]|uniref:ABC transporter ATP-binding protein n=1 Tax=Enterobacter bugandensis TaxID=881260 RepID=UPI00283AB208|nr:ABC transporter ATP-binding protein [Enterobacter bugandensis]WMU75481.1 ABC transporter ATP-binding protein [Enterobacter bugandensis]
MQRQALTLIRLSGVGKTMGNQKPKSPVLFDINLSLYEGDSCVIQGESGAGKSSLLNILGLLDLPTSGELYFRGKNLMSLSPDLLSRIRNTDIGFIFQNFNLLPSLSSQDNIALPLLYRGLSRTAARRFALAQLAQLGMGELAHRKPADLSGGQQQRVAIARSLITRPSLILADEPTGNLDKKAASRVIELLRSLNLIYRTTLVVVTHDPALTRHFNRKIFVQNGRLTEPE